MSNSNELIIVHTGLEEKEEKLLKEFSEKIGAEIKTSTVLNTNYLIIDDENIVIEKPTKKYLRALELIEKGKSIQIVKYSDFFKVFNYTLVHIYPPIGYVSGNMNTTYFSNDINIEDYNFKEKKVVFDKVFYLHTNVIWAYLRKMNASLNRDVSNKTNYLIYDPNSYYSNKKLEAAREQSQNREDIKIINSNDLFSKLLNTDEVREYLVQIEFIRFNKKQNFLEDTNLKFSLFYLVELNKEIRESILKSKSNLNGLIRSGLSYLNVIDEYINFKNYSLSFNLYEILSGHMYDCLCSLVGNRRNFTRNEKNLLHEFGFSEYTISTNRNKTTETLQKEISSVLNEFSKSIYKDVKRLESVEIQIIINTYLVPLLSDLIINIYLGSIINFTKVSSLTRQRNEIARELINNLFFTIQSNGEYDIEIFTELFDTSDCISPIRKALDEHKTINYEAIVIIDDTIDKYFAWPIEEEIISPEIFFEMTNIKYAGVVKLADMVSNLKSEINGYDIILRYFQNDENNISFAGLDLTNIISSSDYKKLIRSLMTLEVLQEFTEDEILSIMMYYSIWLRNMPDQSDGKDNSKLIDNVKVKAYFEKYGFNSRNTKIPVKKSDKIITCILKQFTEILINSYFNTLKIIIRKYADNILEAFNNGEGQDYLVGEFLEFSFVTSQECFELAKQINCDFNSEYHPLIDYIIDVSKLLDKEIEVDDFSIQNGFNYLKFNEFKNAYKNYINIDNRNENLSEILSHVIEEVDISCSIMDKTLYRRPILYVDPDFIIMNPAVIDYLTIVLCGYKKEMSKADENSNIVQICSLYDNENKNVKVSHFNKLLNNNDSFNKLLNKMNEYLKDVSFIEF